MGEVVIVIYLELRHSLIHCPWFSFHSLPSASTSFQPLTVILLLVSPYVYPPDISLSCHLFFSLFLFPDWICQPQPHSTCPTKFKYYLWPYISAMYHYFFFSLSSFRVAMPLFIFNQSMSKTLAPASVREVVLANPSWFLTIRRDSALTSMSHLHAWWLPVSSVSILHSYKVSNPTRMVTSTLCWCR